MDIKVIIGIAKSARLCADSVYVAAGHVAHFVGLLSIEPYCLAVYRFKYPKSTVIMNKLATIYGGAFEKDGQ